MAKRLNPIEKLARSICWEGFLGPASGRGITEAAYWSSLPENTRKRYTEEAERFVWVYQSVDPAIVRAAIDADQT